MGASHSSSVPPILQEIIVPNGKVLVPPYTGFTVHPSPRPRRVHRVPCRRRIPGDYQFVRVQDESESDSESEGEFEMMDGMGMGMRGGFRGGRGGRGGMGMGRFGGLGMEDRPRSAPVGRMGGYDGMVSPRMGGGMPPYMGGGMGQMSGPGMGGMGPSDQPPGYSSMPQMPPRHSGGGGGMPLGGPSPNPYHYPASPHSSSSSADAPPEQRTPRHTPGAHERIPMGLFSKANAQSPKISRSHTETTTAHRLNRKVGSSGKEWIKGDDFLDACICTTNCTCREGHRVLYRSRDGPYGDSDAEARYGAGEIRYILKKDLGRDCGDHSGCKPKADSDYEKKVSKKEKKEEDKKRKKQFEGFKEDILEALDERFDALKKERASKAGSVRSSPRQAFAGPFVMGGQIPNAMDGQPPNAIDPFMAQRFGGGGGMNMGMGPGMSVNMGANPYAMGMPGVLNKMPRVGGDPMSGGRGMRPGQMPGMFFDDEMSMADMGGMGVGNPYSGLRMGGRGRGPRFLSPDGRRNPGGMNVNDIAFYERGAGMNNRRGRGALRGGGRGQRQRGFGAGSDKSDSSPCQSDGRRGNVDHEDGFDNMGGGGLRNDDDGDSPRGIRRVGSARNNPLGRIGRDRQDAKHQAGIETDDDDAY